MKYWSCSEFADKIRGTAKPDSLTSEEWDVWNNEAKTKHPIRYFVVEECFDRIQEVFNMPATAWHSIQYYFFNRWVTKTHALTSNLKKGQWYEFDTRILECLFAELVNYVECEVARFAVQFKDERAKDYKVPKTYFGRRLYRSASLGTACIADDTAQVYDEHWGVEKENPLYGKPTDQAIKAKEVLDLYHWWTKERPNRKDVYQLSGWSAYIEDMDKRYGKSGYALAKTEEEKAISAEILKKIDELEKSYDDEDTEMLIRLIKVRHYLWT